MWVPCLTEFAVPSATLTTPPCAWECGNPSIGTCTTCSKSVCGYCSQMFGGKRTCNTHIAQQRNHEREAEHAEYSRQEQARKQAFQTATTFDELPHFRNMSGEEVLFWNAIARILVSSYQALYTSATLTVSCHKHWIRRATYTIENFARTGSRIWRIPTKSNRYSDSGPRDFFVDETGSFCNVGVGGNPLAEDVSRSALPFPVAVAEGKSPTVEAGRVPRIRNVHGLRATERPSNSALHYVDFEALRALALA
jgi:hypothetical protein